MKSAIHKTVLQLLISLIALSAFGRPRDFSGFRAPSVVGAYYMPWFPIGENIPDRGYMYSIGFYLANGSETVPIIMWKGRTVNEPIEVDSIGALNTVLTDLYAVPIVGVRNDLLIEKACSMVETTGATHGRTGFSLDSTLNRAIYGILGELKRDGLDTKILTALEQFRKSSRVEIYDDGRKWKRSWYEVDAVGGVEHVFVEGSFDPIRVKSVMKEIVMDSGYIPEEKLIGEKLFQHMPNG